MPADGGQMAFKLSGTKRHRNHPTFSPMMLGYNICRYAMHFLALLIDEPVLLGSSFVVDIVFLCQNPPVKANHLAD